MIIEKIIGSIEDFHTENLKIEKVMLDHYDIAKPHQKVKTVDGESIGVSLPHGEHLFCGAVLYKDEHRIIVVDLIPEDVLEIRPVGNLQWGKVAFNIGNMHHPAYLHENCIVIPYDPILEALMESIGVEFRHCQRKLTGEKAGIVMGNHGHTHSHGHHHHQE